jgi:hypothetical protein
LPTKDSDLARKVFPSNQALDLRAVSLKPFNASIIVKTVATKVIIQCLTADGALNGTSKCCTYKRSGISIEIVARS